MKKFTLLAILILLLSCSKDDKKPINNGSDGNFTYVMKSWDGQKRADIFYQIFVRSFADSNGDGIGDIKGITAKLDYLHDLGVSGIWLTPIHPSPSYHGYDVEDYRAIDPVYGTMADFEMLISKANALNIKVVLDLVINHTSKTHPWFTSATSSIESPYRDWFLFAPSNDVAGWISSGKVPMTKSYNPYHWHSVSSGTTNYKYMGMFSDWMPEINYGEVSTSHNSLPFKEMVEISKFWLSKGVAGFRLDAVKHIYQDENSNENPLFLKKFYEAVSESKPDLYMIGENLTGDYNLVAPYYSGLPALFNFDAWYKLIYVLENSHAKWYPKDIMDMEQRFKSVRSNAINATKLSNHDEDRTFSRLGNNMQRAKMAASILFTVSGSPYLYYGEEIGMRGMKTTGDINVREPFLWDAKANDTYRTSWFNPVNSVEPIVTPLNAQKMDSLSIFNHYKSLIKLRNTYESLSKGRTIIPENFDNYSKNFMAFYREHNNEKLFVLHNVSDGVATFIYDRPFKNPIIRFGGVLLSRINDRTITITMPPYSSIILEI